MAHQNGRGDTFAAGFHNGFDNGLVMSCGHSNNAGRTALGGGNNAVNGVDHGKIPPKYVILLLFKATNAQKQQLFMAILYNKMTTASTSNRSIQ